MIFLILVKYAYHKIQHFIILGCAATTICLPHLKLKWGLLHPYLSPPGAQPLGTRCSSVSRALPVIRELPVIRRTWPVE